MTTTTRTMILVLCLTISACEDVTNVTQVVADPGPIGGGAPPSDPPANLSASLNDLGVGTASTPRVSNEGVPLPEDYAPFGNRIVFSTLESGEVVIGAPNEVAFVGFSLDAENAFLTVVDNLPPEEAGTVRTVTPRVISKSDTAQAPWAREQNGFEWVAPLTFRDSTGSDVDGDGLAEFVTIRFESGLLILSIAEIDDPTVVVDERIIDVPPAIAAVGDVRIAGGDFDNDGRDELLLAISQTASAGQATNVVVVVLDDTDSDFQVITEFAYQSVLLGADVSVVLKSGNIDYDVALEIIVVLNELDITRSDGVPDAAMTRIFVYDDAATDFAQLVAERPEVVTATASYIADVASVAIGDIDGDDLNEILVAGLSGITITANSCNQSPDGGPGPIRYLAVLFEFNGLSIGQTDSSHSGDQDSIYPSNCVDDGPWVMRFPYVNTVNLDADRQHEFHINQFVFDGFPQAGLDWGASASAILPRTVFFPEGSSDRLVFDRHSAVIETGDVNSDGRGDIISFRAGVDTISIFSNTTADGFRRSATIPLESVDPLYRTSPGALNPQIIVFNGDMANEGDTQIMAFDSHVVDFSEPIVIAALAAPPCIASIDQNRESCVTSWGKSEAVSIEGEREFSFSAGISLGVSTSVDASVPFVGGLSVNVFAFEAKGTLTREAGRLKSESYEVTKSVSFETGPEEDSVVFASIPYDVYRYKVLNNTLDEGMNGTTFYDVGLPREAVVRLATTKYYNARTMDNATKIDAAVFAHRPGEIDSYPTLEDRANILDQQRSLVETLRSDCPFCWELDPEADKPWLDGPFRTFDPFAALPGLVSEAVGVGQGSGSTEVGIELNVSNGTGNSLARSWEGEVEFVVYGVLFGFQVGGGTSFSTSITRSTGKSYVGTVGSISDADFSDNQYSFGMFTYLQSDPGSGQEFEVINYWVE
jgi:hypothetical protein